MQTAIDFKSDYFEHPSDGIFNIRINLSAITIMPNGNVSFQTEMTMHNPNQGNRQITFGGNSVSKGGYIQRDSSQEVFDQTVQNVGVNSVDYDDLVFAVQLFAEKAIAAQKAKFIAENSSATLPE